MHNAMPGSASSCTAARWRPIAQILGIAFAAGCGADPAAAASDAGASAGAKAAPQGALVSRRTEAELRALVRCVEEPKRAQDLVPSARVAVIASNGGDIAACVEPLFTRCRFDDEATADSRLDAYRQVTDACLREYCESLVVTRPAMCDGDGAAFLALGDAAKAEAQAAEMIAAMLSFDHARPIDDEEIQTVARVMAPLWALPAIVAAGSAAPPTVDPGDPVHLRVDPEGWPNAQGGASAR